MDKKAIRRLCGELVARLSPQQKAMQSESVFKQLLENARFLRAQSIFIYLSFEGEIDTTRIIDYALRAGKRVYVPRIEKGKMYAVRFDNGTELESAAFGIKQPREINEQPEGDCDIVVVPAAAFTIEGARLGRGGGYYDRFLLGTSSYKIGVCFDVQIMHSLPVEPHDIPMDTVLFIREQDKCEL